MPNTEEFDVVVTRQAPGTKSANVIDFGRPLFVIRDIPGPNGIPLMNTPWTLSQGGEKIASGVTDRNGRVNILNALEPGTTYELEYPGRTVSLETVALAAIASVKGMQQRLICLGYDPGPDDGDAGPRTRSALMNFQSDYELVVDGIYGPKSRGKLREVFGR